MAIVMRRIGSSFVSTRSQLLGQLGRTIHLATNADASVYPRVRTPQRPANPARPWDCLALGATPISCNCGSNDGRLQPIVQGATKPSSRRADLCASEVGSSFQPALLIAA
jgi:hypothetical protein